MPVTDGFTCLEHIRREALPVKVLVGLYMGMLRESKSLPGTHPAASLVSVLFDGIARREQGSLP